MAVRKIVKIDEEKCNGCGLCVPSCEEGAIRVIGGKARLVNEMHCDGLGNCLGECPQGAITMEEREVEEPVSLGNWPVQLSLVPPAAPYLRGADVLLAADCVPFAYADFHKNIRGDRPVIIGCPKLDDARFYVEKLAELVRTSGLSSLTVVRMEVPCCSGLVRIAELAVERAGVQIPVETITVSIGGEVL